MDFPSEAKLREIPIEDYAYIGDAVYELYVRQACLNAHKYKPAKLNSIVIKYVNAKYQAEAAIKIQDFLTEKESNILRRGRNANPGTKAKNANIEEYRLASGLESLIGYTYLKHDLARVEELMQKIMKQAESEEELE